jgi:hypothetical protein
MTRKLTALAVFALVAAPAVADVESGPKAGEKVEKLKVHAVVGPIEDKEVDYAAERKDAPTVYLFVNAEKFDRPMARFMKVLDEKVGEAAEKSANVAVWVGGETDPTKTRLEAINKSLKFEKTALAVYTTDKAGPAGWGLNTDAHLTVVVANGGKVVKSFAYTTVNETDTQAVLAELKKAAGK